MLKLLLFNFIALFTTLEISAQTAIVPVGGDASNANGSYSYSAGQVDYIPLNNTTNAGVQQPYDSLVVLPVQFLNIKAVKQGKNVLVSWQTASENNSRNFEIYRSNTSREFIDKVGTLSASGYSNNLKNYSLLDKSPFSGFNYYRIKQVDKDSKYIFSAVVAVNFEAGINISIYPNPAKSFVKLQINTNNISEYSYALFDINGKKITNGMILTANSSINIKDVKPAAYTLRIYNNSTEVSSFIIIKN